MFITVTSPKKGMGQTITAINFSASFANITDQTVNIIDMNKYCRDIEYYLSDSKVTKGLDEFINLRSTSSLDRSLFSACMKRVERNIHMMASNNYLELDDEDMDTLIEYTKSIYDLTVVDSIGGKNRRTRQLLKKSDAILVILNQCKRVVDMVAENEQYLSCQGKVVFIINKYMGSHGKVKLNYGMGEIESDLKKLGYTQSRVFPLDYDTEILNECNDRSVLNFILSRQAGQRAYNLQMKEIVNHITEELREKPACEVGPVKRFIGLRLGKLFG